MGSEPDDYEPSLTVPKLSYFALPSKPNEPPGMSTPPIHTLASVPFQWEEAPGKPRPSCTNQSKPKTARCLELPPRLLNEAKVANMPSPTTVLDGPYVSRSLSRSLSFGKGKSFSGFENLGKKMNKERVIFGSGRWGSLKRNKEVVQGSFEFSSSTCPGRNIVVNDGGTKVKIRRVRRQSSFFSFSSTRSHLWTSISEGFKLVVPWRRRQEKSSKMSL